MSKQVPYSAYNVCCPKCGAFIDHQCRRLDSRGFAPTANFHRERTRLARSRFESSEGTPTDD